MNKITYNFWEVYLDPSNKAMHNLTVYELSERTEQARNDQVAIVEAIKVHQNECLMNLPKDEFDDICNGRKFHPYTLFLV
jgi:hypothetical protein